MNATWKRLVSAIQRLLPGTRPGKPATFRPTLETFEDRLVPSASVLLSPNTPGQRPDAVASGFTHSAEYFANQVSNAYQHFLGRAANATEVAVWVNGLEHGLSDEQLAASFVSSAEYTQKHGGAGTAWVQGLYQDVLGRTASQAEVSGWMQALSQGVSPTTVANRVASSNERETDRVSADYQTVLGRAPTPAEAKAWVEQLLQHTLSNEDLLANMVLSDEYLGAHGSPYGGAHPLAALGASGVLTDYVYRLGTGDEYIGEHGGDSVDWLRGVYQDVLGRQADIAGLNFWLQALGSGAEVIVGP